jgi:hypothetical protein
MTIFSEGEVYYRLTYPDVGFLYPTVETFVYVGKNLSDADCEDTWYFQFASDFAKYGSIIDNNRDDLRVCCVKSLEACDMLSQTELVKELDEAASRRRKINSQAP